MSRPDDRQNEWRLLRPLGQGTSARVWLAADGSGRRAALKVFPAIQGPEARHLFAAEATALGRLRHPLAPKLLWVGENSIAMELVRGRPLDRALAPPVSPARLVPLLLDLLDVLAHAHSLGVIHCDLKPANLLVERTAALPSGVCIRLHVVDFGLAEVRALDTFGRRAVAGTLAYMAPEQRAAKRVDGRADLYSTGAIARALLGEVLAPFDRLLADDPDDRPATAEAAIAEIVRAWGDGGSPIAQPPRGLPHDQALRFALGTADVPAALARRSPAAGLGRFLLRERDAGRLARGGRTWTYAALVRDAEALRHDGRAEEAIAAHVSAGELVEAAELHCRRREYDDALRLLERAERTGRRAEARLARGTTLREMGRYPEAARILASVRRGARGLLRGRAAAEEGFALAATGRLDDAARRYGEALRLARAARDPALEGTALLWLGHLALRRDKATAAEQLAREALACVRAAGEWDRVAMVLVALGVACRMQLRLDEAAAAFDEALATYRRLGDRKGTLRCLLNGANVYARRLDLKAARTSYEEALRLAREIGDLEHEGAVLLNLAAIETLAGRFRAGLAHAEAAVMRLEATPNRSYLALAIRNRGDAIRRASPGDAAALDRAEADFLRARALAEEAEDREVAVECELDLADVEGTRGYHVQAAARASAAFAEASERGFAEHAIRAHVILARAYNKGGIHPEALAEARAAEEKAVAAGTVFHRLEALREGAAALAALGRVEEARAARDAAESAEAALADAAGGGGECEGRDGARSG